MDWEYQLIDLYITIDRYFKEGLFYLSERFSNNTEVNLTDEEVMTTYLWGIISGHRKLKDIHRFTQNHLHEWFPLLPSYTSWVRRINRLSDTFIPLIEKILLEKNLPSMETFLIDSMPVILANGKRSQKAKVAPDIADKGYCSTKSMFYYGVKIHLIASSNPSGLPSPTHIGITGASIHDLAAARDVFQTIQNSEIYADKAYCDESLKTDTLEKQNTDLHTPIKTSKSKKFLDLSERLYSTGVSKIRQPIESFFSWLQEKTMVQCASKVRSRSGLDVHIFGRIAAALFMLFY